MQESNGIIDQHLNDEDENPDEESKQKTKAKEYNGLLEWILEQEGHEYMCEVDRQFIKEKANLIGIQE
jgi:hypothetical protein